MKLLRLIPAAILALGLLGPAPARAQCSEPYLVEQSFPKAGPEETRWRICWQMQKQFGMVITSAFFRTSPEAPWMRVFWDARVSEIFVPYHGNENRFLDVMGFNWDWVRLQPDDCPAGAGGTLLGPGPKWDACKIVRDRGLAWKYYDQRRRGEELILWGVIAAANYNYLVEWTFRDDGMVIGRVGATGPNYPGHPSVAHIHSPIWRLDVDLNGWPEDIVHLGVHTEDLPGPKATDSMVMISKESGFAWDPLNFHSFHIGDASLKNGRGNPSMLHLMPLRYGTPRHQEDFTKKDLWVTRYHPTEIYGALLPSFLNDESVEKTDVVVWYMGSVHHMARDEDRTEDNGWLALAMWSEFHLKPHNLFTSTPLYP
ncbi:MAG: hypothetical protein ACJ75H_01675 [Thermoanaerobaculia bacterium]